MSYKDWKDSLGHTDNNTPHHYALYCKKHIDYNKNQILAQKNKLITNTVRVSSSEYAMNKASATSSKNVFMHQLESKPVPNGAVPNGTAKILQWNQSSDRAFPSRYLAPYKNKNNIPSHGNSTKKSLTRHRPGSGAGGHQLGVDIKHNSYHRYLLKKKGLKPLRGEKPSEVPSFSGDKQIQNNKYKKGSIVAGLQFCCQPGKPLFPVISEN
tara:strand:- start:1046 stop:1678 length:633 start_codon:yes stop_codon:yes gene_type:complete